MDSQKRKRHLSEKAANNEPTNKKRKVKAGGGTLTPHGIPTELLEKILGSITAVSDVWRVQQVNSVFQSLAWKSVTRLEFDLYNSATSKRFTRSRPRMSITQHIAPREDFSVNLKDMENHFPLLWEKCTNLKELEFEFCVGYSDHKFLEFVNMVSNLQTSDDTEKKIEGLVLRFRDGHGFTRPSVEHGFTRPSVELIEACTRYLVSADIAGIYSSSADLIGALMDCQKLKRVSVPSAKFLLTLKDKPGIHEIKFRHFYRSNSQYLWTQEPHQGICVNDQGHQGRFVDFFPGVDVKDEVCLRVCDGFLEHNILNPKCVLTFPFGSITCLAMDLHDCRLARFDSDQFFGWLDTQDLDQFFGRFPKLKNAIVFGRKDGSHYSWQSYGRAIISFLLTFRNSENNPKLSLRLLDTPQPRAQEALRVISGKVQASLNLVGVLFGLDDNEEAETVGAEAEEGFNFNRHSHMKFQLGAAECRVTPSEMG